MPDVQLIADSTTVLGQGQDLVRAGQSDNPYDGIISAEGETGAVHSKGENFKRCNDDLQEVHRAATCPAPNEVVKAPNGKRNDIYGAVSDACAEVTMFLDIATKAGATLNNDNVDRSGRLDGQDADRVEPSTRRCTRASTTPTTRTAWWRSTRRSRRTATGRPSRRSSDVGSLN